MKDAAGEDTPPVLAIDGGATATRALLVTGEGTVIGQGSGGPCGPVLSAQAREVVAGRVVAAVSEAVIEATRGEGHVTVAAVHAGLTGMDRPAERIEWLRAALESLSGRLEIAGPLGLSSDLETAVEGALGPAMAGILVYAGTGSVGAGRSASGQLVRAGGQGYLIDDRGGGFDIGRMALQAVVRAWDGRGPHTVLEELVCQTFGVTGWDGLKRAIYGAPDPKAAVAGVAPLVAEAVRLGDEAARRIVREAAGQLAELALALFRRIRWPAEGPVPVRFAGGAFKNPALVQAFSDQVERLIPGARAERGVLPPAGGAVLMALRAAGLGPDRLASVTSRLVEALGPA
ncbi:MAG: BadF/BadG/BcrA/BcrD ATPase family protein [Bacillota bacterium]